MSADRRGPDDDGVVRSGPWCWAVPAVGVSLALVIGAGDLNRQVFAAVNGWARPGTAAADFWIRVTTLGVTEVAMGLALPLLLRRHPTLLLAATLTAFLAATSSWALKTTTDVDRPVSVLAADEVVVLGSSRSRRSFPSGHTNTAFATAGLLALCSRRRRTRWALVALASLVGLSRVVVGAHWPLDVVAGAALGWGLAVVGWRLARDRSAAAREGRAVMLGLVALGVVTVFRRMPGSDAPGVCLVAGALGLWALVLAGRELLTDRGAAHPGDT